MCPMPRPHPRSSVREDVIRIAHNREPGVRIEDVAADLGSLRGLSQVPGLLALMSRTAQAGNDRRGERRAALRQADPAPRTGERAAAYLPRAKTAGKMIYPSSESSPTTGSLSR
jgi:hypothetical protein